MLTTLLSLIKKSWGQRTDLVCFKMLEAFHKNLTLKMKLLLIACNNFYVNEKAFLKWMSMNKNKLLPPQSGGKDKHQLPDLYI